MYVACILYMCMLRRCCIWLWDPRTIACQAPQSVEFSRQEYWSELPFPSPDLPDPGIDPTYPALHADSLLLSHWFLIKNTFFLKDFFWCGPFLKSLLNLLQDCLFYVLVYCLQGMWGLSSLSRDQTCTPVLEGRLNPWTTREVPWISFNIQCPSRSLAHSLRPV